KILKVIRHCNRVASKLLNTKYLIADSPDSHTGQKSRRMGHIRYGEVKEDEEVGHPPKRFDNISAMPMRMEEARGYVFQALRENDWNQEGTPHQARSRSVTEA